MYPGTYVQIHSTRRAWDAISNGQATFARCSVCRKRFQIAKSAKVLYCTNCSSLTSLDTPDTEAPSTKADEASDHQIAAQLHRAEFNIAKDKAAGKKYSQKKDSHGVNK
jgi:ribosomal protein L37AE/L43A